MEEGSIPRPLVEIYSKPGCSLCVATRSAAEAVQRRVRCDLVEVDVRQDRAMLAHWRYDLPVVCIDGAVAFLRGATEAELEQRLRERVSALRGGSSPAPAPGGTGPG